MLLILLESTWWLVGFNEGRWIGNFLTWGFGGVGGVEDIEFWIVLIGEKTQNSHKNFVWELCKFEWGHPNSPKNGHFWGSSQKGQT
jgi:hypothetical protein